MRTVLRKGQMPYQRVEAALVVTRLAAYVVVLLVLLPPGLAAAFFVVQYAVFGLCLGGSFAPSHKGMPIVASTATIDFLRRQVLMSRNVRGGFAVDAAMGGLNYQIEHHLFPSMPRPNLKRAQPIVRAYCIANDVSYSEVGLFESYGIVVSYLNNVGLQARGLSTVPWSRRSATDRFVGTFPVDRARREQCPGLDCRSHAHRRSGRSGSPISNRDPGGPASQQSALRPPSQPILALEREIERRGQRHDQNR